MHGDAGDAGLTRVLHAVAVDVFPHLIADNGLGRLRHIEGDGVRGEIQIIAATTVGTAGVANLEVEADGAARIHRCGIGELACHDVGSQDFLAGDHGNAVKQQGARRRDGGDQHRFEAVALDRIGETEVVEAQHVEVAIGEDEGLIGAGGGVIHRRHVDRQIQDKAVAGAVRAENPDLQVSVEVRQVGHVHREGVLVDGGEIAGGGLDVLGAVENIELDACRFRCGVIGIGLLEQIEQLEILAGVFAKGNAG